MLKRFHPRATLVAFTLLATFALLGASSCNDSAKTASVAVNKYANSLSSFQDAEIKMHDAGKVDDDMHREILKKEKMAATAGLALDKAIAIASSGGDYSAYIDSAEATFNDLVAQAKANDLQTQQELITYAATAGALLKNAVALIKAIQPAPKAPGAFWFMFLPLMAAAALPFSKWFELLQIVSTLEPIAFELVTNLAKSLKGQTAEQVLALNERLFNKVTQTADAELAKLPPESGIAAAPASPAPSASSGASATPAPAPPEPPASS